MQERQKLILNFYSAVNKQNWLTAMRIFANTIQYERHDIHRTQVISSKDNLYNFYVYDRDIHGVYTVQQISSTPDTVMVKGKFTGARQGKPIDLEYTDEFVFNNNDKVVKRKSRIWEAR